eukprot:3816517-Rhodomonas_salina.1
MESDLNTANNCGVLLLVLRVLALCFDFLSLEYPLDRFRPVSTKDFLLLPPLAAPKQTGWYPGTRDPGLVLTTVHCKL